MSRLFLLQIAAAALIAGLITVGSQLLPPAAPNACNTTRDIFYRQEDKPPSGALSERNVLFRFDPSRGQAVEHATLRGYFFPSGSGYDRKGRLLLFSNTEAATRRSLHVYSICTGELRKAVELPETNRWIISAQYAGESDTLLVTTSEGEVAHAGTNSHHEVYANGVRTVSAQISAKSEIYAAAGYAGVTPDGSLAYIGEVGGDGGDIWGTYYVWDRRTNSVQKLGGFEGNELGIRGLYLGGFSPSAQLAMRVRAAGYAEGDVDNSAGGGCLTKAALESGRYDSVGDELVVREVSSGQERVAFRNLSGAKNACQNKSRTVSTPIWRDDRTIAFVTPGGIHETDVQGGDPRLVVSESSTERTEHLRLTGANDEYLFTSRASIVHAKSGKETRIPALRSDPKVRNSSVYTQVVLPAWTRGSEWDLPQRAP